MKMFIEWMFQIFVTIALPPIHYCSIQNGRCQSLSDKYLCTCDEGYIGHKCEYS